MLENLEILRGTKGERFWETDRQRWRTAVVASQGALVRVDGVVTRPAKQPLISPGQ